MAPHSSTLAWKIPWTEEPGRLQSIGSLSQTRLGNFTFTFQCHALEKEMATHSRFLREESQGRRSLVGCRLWGRMESDMTEATQQQQRHDIFEKGMIIFNGKAIYVCLSKEKILKNKNRFHVTVVGKTTLHWLVVNLTLVFTPYLVFIFLNVTY